MTTELSSVAAAHDFDFLHGEWSIANTRLVRILDDCDDWYEFPATSWCRPLLGGAGNVDEFLAPDRDVFGASFRIFDPSTSRWAIYWASSTALGLLEPPVIGGFVDGVGTFVCDDDFRRPACHRALCVVRHHPDQCSVGTGFLA